MVFFCHPYFFFFWGGGGGGRLVSFFLSLIGCFMRPTTAHGVNVVGFFFFSEIP